MPDAKVDREIGRQVEILIDESKLNTLATLLKDIEDFKEEYKVVSFGISSPTINDVFMKYFV